jgi:hypothetical protein
VPNHEDVDSSEHQIRLSKGLIAKFVQLLKLGAGFAAEYRRQTKKATVKVAFCPLQSVTGTVSIFRIANGWV